MANTYGKFNVDVTDIKRCLQDEFNGLEQTFYPDLEKHIQAIIGLANESTGNKCTINYENNTVES